MRCIPCAASLANALDVPKAAHAERAALDVPAAASRHACCCRRKTGFGCPSAGYLQELEHGRFDEMTLGQKVGTATAGLAAGGIMYEVRAVPFYTITWRGFGLFC